MKQTKNFIVVFLTIFISVTPALTQNNTKNNMNFPELSGPYLGQNPPGLRPQLFAYDIIDKGDKVFSITFSPNGKEFYYTNSPDPNTGIIMESKEINGSWTEPSLASFASHYSESEPLLSPDGQKLIFDSSRPLPGTDITGHHLWYVEKNGNAWTEPLPMNAPFTNRFVMYATIASNKNIYLTADDDEGPGIFVSKYVNGNYQELERLGQNINHLQSCAHPFISADENYIIFDAEVDGKARDLFISFRNIDGEWMKSISLGTDINTDNGELTPFVTADSKYLFFSRMTFEGGDIYWVDASIIDSLNPISTSINHATSNKPKQFLNYPNPFSEKTNILFELSEPEKLSINILNTNGIIIQSLLKEKYVDYGINSIILDGADYLSGIYYCVIQSKKSIIASHKLIKIN